MLEIEWTDAAGELQQLGFDVALREGYEGAAEVTEHPVEDGADVADHVRAQNEALTFEAWVTDHPITIPGTAMDGVTGGTSTVALASGQRATGLVYSQRVERVRLVDETLRRLKDAGQVLTVRTGFREVGGCVIERYRVDRDAESGSALPVSLDFKRIRVATSRTVPVTAPTQRRGQRRGQRGAQPATTTPPDRRSAAARGVDAAAPRARAMLALLGIGGRS